MGRIARVVAPGMPHHVTQRASVVTRVERENVGQQTFFGEDDCRAYLELMKQWCGQHGVDFDGDDANETYAGAQSGMLTGTSKLILTKYSYDAYSRPYLVTDNDDKDTATFFDDAGRRTHVVENYDPNTCSDPDDPDSRNSDVNRVTKYVYNEAGQVSRHIAVDVDHDGDADTQY